MLVFAPQSIRAKTQIIPAAKSLKLPMVSRNSKLARFAYLPAGFTEENHELVERALQNTEKSIPLLVEPPFSCDGQSFKDMHSYICENNTIVYASHYMHKFIPDLAAYSVDYDDIQLIKWTQHSTAGHESETYGIVHNPLQPHGLFVISSMLAHLCQSTRISVLDTVVPFKLRDCTLSTHMGYTGSLQIPTQGRCETRVDNIKLVFDIGYKMPRDCYSILIISKEGTHSFQIEPQGIYEYYEDSRKPLCTKTFHVDDSYKSLLMSASLGSLESMPAPNEIAHCWDLVSELL